MRKRYAEIIKTEFQKSLIKARTSRGLTQEQMAPRLRMSVRAYCGLENGENSCGAITLIIFLLYICTDPAEFLEGLRKAFEAESSDASRLVS